MPIMMTCVMYVEEEHLCCKVCFAGTSSAASAVVVPEFEGPLGKIASTGLFSFSGPIPAVASHHYAHMLTEPWAGVLQGSR